MLQSGWSQSQETVFVILPDCGHRPTEVLRLRIVACVPLVQLDRVLLREDHQSRYGVNQVQDVVRRIAIETASRAATVAGMIVLEQDAIPMDYRLGLDSSIVEECPATETADALADAIGILAEGIGICFAVTETVVDATAVPVELRCCDDDRDCDPVQTLTATGSAPY